MSKSIYISKDEIKNYSINLMWINASKQNTAPVGEISYWEDDEGNECMYKSIPCEERTIASAIKWAIENPEAEVNVFYDSKLSFSGCMQDFLSNANAPSNVKIKDVWDIGVVKENPHLFSEKIPIYFRVDFLKLIICLQSLSIDKKDAVIYADIEVGNLRADNKRMNKDEIFKQEIMNKLEQFGIVVGVNEQGNSDNFRENQFFQIVNNDLVTEALKVYVNTCLTRGNEYIDFPEDIKYKGTMHCSPFKATIQEIPKYYATIKNGGHLEVSSKFLKECLNIKTQENEDWVNYNPQIHGYKPLSNVVSNKNAYREESLYYDAKSKPPILYENILRYCSKEDINLKKINICRYTCTRGGHTHDEPPIDVEDHPANVVYWDEAVSIAGGSIEVC